MQRKHVYIVAATAAVMGIAIIARLQWRPARSDEPTSPERHDRGAAAADVRRAGPAAARGPACVTQRDPVRPRGPRGALDLMSGAARVQALAVSTEFPNPTLRLVSDRVTSPAAQLARQMLSDETTALLSSAPIIGFARDGDRDAMAVFAGVSRRELQLDDAPDVLWLAPDTVALWTGRVESVCRTRGASALARLREIDPALDRAATIAGFWRGSVDDAPASCVEMVGAIHLPPSRYASGHGWWLCGNETDAAAGARFLTTYSAARSTESIPGLVLQVVTGGDELIPRSAHPQGNRVRAEFASRVAVGPAPHMSPEALRYYRRGEAIPPWEQPDPWGYPQVDGPPPGYDDIDPGPERPPVARPPGWQGPTRSIPTAPPAAPNSLE